LCVFFLYIRKFPETLALFLLGKWKKKGEGILVVEY
jgi:hypothetical protein